MDIGGNKIKAVQSRLDMINGQIDQTTGHINKANVAIKTAKRYVVIYIYTHFFISFCLIVVQSRVKGSRSYCWL